jgi:hypothetical protein
MARSIALACLLALSLVLPSCGGASLRDPPPRDLSRKDGSAITGRPTNPPPGKSGAGGFAAPTGEHLCKSGEVVVFACVLEGGDAPMMSICLVNGSPRSEPELRARERPAGGPTEDVYGPRERPTLMKTVLKMDEKPFSEEVELRLSGKNYGITRITEIKDRSLPRTYTRSRSPGPRGEKQEERPCRAGAAARMTDNIDAMYAYSE